MLTVTIGRDSLSLSPLVLTADPSAGLYIADIGEPGFSPRYLYAPDSDHLAGSTLLAVTLEASQVALTVYARGTTTAEKQAQMDTLTAAVSQFSWPLTIDLDGQAQTFSADFTWPQWTSLDSGMAAAHLASTTLAIPVNPPGA